MLPHPLIPTPPSDITPIFQIQIRDLSASSFRTIQPVIPSSYKYIPRFLNRQQQGLLCRLRLGHTPSTHSYLLSKTPPPVCPPRCSQSTTVRHFLLECPLYQQARVTAGLASSLSDILSYNPVSIAALFSFLQLPSSNSDVSFLP